MFWLQDVTECAMQYHVITIALLVVELSDVANLTLDYQNISTSVF